MTPAVETLNRFKISHTLHEYQHNPSADSYGLEAAEKLKLDPQTVYKTLVCQLNTQELVVAVIPVTEQLNLKLLAKAANSKKAVMANPMDVERTTGYVLGGVSPLGQKKPLKTYIHKRAVEHKIIYVSAGKRGLEIGLSPNDLLNLTKGQLAVLCN
ncbi:Cys-tRNA(Pro) deacylase [Alteromonas facilis]|uniref:Cys-tRNA(Pro) deacylase n=1 Tax=Alteromonas facilis TaxID=2048004 RepID=UPI000C286A6E|nr:Cys-tRNA(Pro) deacylase [Alteromonas facilis]